MILHSQKKRLGFLKKKHVCIDARLILASGIGTYLRAIVPVLCQHPSFDISILCGRRDVNLVSSFSPRQLTILNSPIYSLKEQQELFFKIPSCDLFWSPHFNIPLLPIKAKKRLVTIHDAYHLSFFSTLSLIQKAYASCFYNAACRFSDHIITVSDFSAAELKKYCSLKEEKLFIIKLGAHSIFSPRERCEKNHIKFSLPDKYLLAVTNFKPHKNFPRIREACRGILPLVVVGEKKVEGALSTGNVSDDELAYLYSQAEALLFPSLYEGYGLPAREAMACGTPVITSKLASLPEVCEDAAEYVDPYNVFDIRRGIVSLLSGSKRMDLVRKGLLVAQKRTLETSAYAHVELIEHFL